MHIKKIAIIILNYNSSGDCRECIADLKLQVGIDMEIIVVDNCSRDDDRMAVEMLCKDTGCTFLANHENRGYNAGNNIGLRYAAKKNYEYAMVCNPDMRFPQKDYIAKLTMILRDNDEITVAASDILHYDGYHQNPCKADGDWQESIAGLVRLLFLHNTGDKLDFIDNWETCHFCHKVSGCCFAIRLSFLQRIGFFDEYPFLYCEEAILASQVKRDGSKMFYSSDIQSFHCHIKHQKGDPNFRIRQWCRSRLYFQKKYSDDPLYGKVAVCCAWFLYSCLLLFKNVIRRNQ